MHSDGHNIRHILMMVTPVHRVHVKVGEEDGDHDDGYLKTYDFDSGSPEHDRLSDIEDMLDSCEDVLQYLFGDHCQVTIWRNKNEATVEEYEHD